MLKIFGVIFLSFFVYGIVTGLLGAGLLSLCMFGLTCYSARVFERQDTARKNDPAWAVKPIDTLTALDEHCCECTQCKWLT